MKAREGGGGEGAFDVADGGSIAAAGFSASDNVMNENVKLHNAAVWANAVMTDEFDRRRKAKDMWRTLMSEQVEPGAAEPDSLIILPRTPGNKTKRVSSI